jgi:hypothetical protein
MGLLSIRGVVTPSLLFYGGVELAHVRGHARGPAKPCESVVYDSGGVSYLSCAQRSCISCYSEGISRGVCGVLRVGIRCAIASISPFPAVVLWIKAISVDSFGDPVDGGLHDPF